MKKLLAIAVLALLAASALPFAAGPAAAHQTILADGCVQNPGRPGTPFKIEAKVKWFGNHYGRMSNGIIISTLMGCPWEGCYIEVDGKTIRLEGLPGDIVDQQNYVGQTLLLVGRLVHEESAQLKPRDGFGTAQMPPDVLIVDAFRKLA
jgi:hypothetical protein